MGKNKGFQKKQTKKNVFKVATVRGDRLKVKAQKVLTNLKKLDLKKNKVNKVNKDKAAQIDKQLEELRKEVYQSKPKIKVTKAKQSERKKMQNTVPIQTDATTSLVEKMQI
ncbi:uncharacterized protein [Bombus fervidus]|uniref:uncharacterized protein n=1 Tax=Bombus fervidus TaxID=203811 RepID=UPI003AB2E1B8